MSGFPVFSAETQCFGKRGFTHKQDAKRAARATEQTAGKRLTVYRCPHCSLWHSGTDFRRRKAA